MENIVRWTTFTALLIINSTSIAANEYEIGLSHSDERFIINDEKYKAKTYCFDMKKGDRVIFLEGSPYGACVSAELLDLRTETVCNVWCE